MQFSQIACLKRRFFGNLKKTTMRLKGIRNRSNLGRVLVHLIFWLSSLVLFSVLIFYTRDFRISAMDFKTAVNILVTIFLLAVSVYINILWLLPSFFSRRKFLLFAVLEILNIALFICLNYGISMAFEGRASNYYNEMIAEFILVLIFLIISTLITFTQDSMSLRDAELKITEIERQKIESELQALKAQFNPHFFFNTLNSLYSLSLDKSDKAPELILKLSDLMRYVLYDTREDCIPMKKQLGFLESYIYLEKLRTDDSLRIDLDIQGDNRDICIAPLLIEPFVENAFKHGARDKKSNPFIRIKIDLSKPGKVFFMIENNTDNDSFVQKESAISLGIGLTNIKKRLDLLYPGKHQLIISEAPGHFRVELNIETNENKKPGN